MKEEELDNFNPEINGWTLQDLIDWAEHNKIDFDKVILDADSYDSCIWIEIKR